MATFRLRAAHIAGLRLGRFAAALQERLQREGKKTSYDPNRKAVYAADAVGRTFAYRFGPDGFIDAVRSPAGRVWHLSSDSEGNLLQYTEPSGRVTELTYDQDSVPTAFGRDGHTLCSFQFNPDRTRSDATFWDGSRSSSVYDARQNPILLTNRLGKSQRFTYDSRARLRSFTDGNGEVTRFGYGANGKLSLTEYSDGHREFASYDGAGNVARLFASDSRGVVVRSTPEGRPTEVRYPDQTAYEFQYAEGRVTAAKGPRGRSEYRYADTGELIEEKNDEQSFKFEHDPTGLLLSIEYPDQTKVFFEYNEDKQLTRITDWSGAPAAVRHGLDDRSRVTLLANGLETASTLTPSGKPQRTATRHTRSGSLLYETLSTFDLQDRLTAHADSEFGKCDFSYDAESQLLAVRSGTGELLEWFSYDAAGNRSSNSGNAVSIGPRNRLISAWNARCEYDGHGNLIAATWYGKPWRYVYDARHQLILAEGPDGPIEFEYDAFGRRTLKRSKAGEIRFVWCGEQLTRELITAADGSQHTRDYLYLPGTHTPFALRVDGRVYYYHCDHQGTPHRLTDASGAIVWAAEYSAFGKATVHVEAVENPLRFAGQYFDGETDLSYNRFRYYSAELGRYITPDPVGLLGGPNLYLYVGNDPLNKTDPLGLWWKAALAIAAGVAVAAAIVITAPVSLPLLAGAAVLGVAVGVGVDKALNIDHFCIACAASAFASGFVSGLEMAAGFALAAALVPEAAGALVVGGAVVGCYALLAEHLGWPMPAGELTDPSTWHMHSGKPFEQMTDEEKSASLGNLAGGTAGAIAGGALAEGALGEPGAPAEGAGEGPFGDGAFDDPPIEEAPPEEGDPLDEGANEEGDEEPSDEEDPRPSDEEDDGHEPDDGENDDDEAPTPEPEDDDLPPPRPGGDPGAPPRQPGEPVGSDGLTSEQRAYYRDQIDNASDPEAAQQARYDRNTTARENAGKEPNSPEDWQRQNDQLRQNQSTGSTEENDTLDSLGVRNNNNVTTNPDGTVNRPETFPKGTDADGVETRTRPDGITDKALIDNKSAPDTFDADGNPRTVYNDEQLRAQQEAARNSGREPVTVITNENPAAVRPSGPLADESTVLHRNTADGSWSQWNKETNSWDPISQDQARAIVH